MKLDQDNVTRACQLSVDYGFNTAYVAERYDISHRRIQQLAKANREIETIPTLQTPGRTPHAEYPNDHEERILTHPRRLDAGATAIAHVFRTSNGLSISSDHIHVTLKWLIT